MTTGPVALLDEAGYVLLPALLPTGPLDEIVQALEPWLQSAVGSRNLLRQPQCRSMAVQLKTQLLEAGLLDEASTAVQCTLFDKTSDRNWLVALHQDTSIPAFISPPDAAMPVAIKEGEPYVRPPVAVLEVAARRARASSGRLRHRRRPAARRAGQPPRGQARRFRGASDARCAR